MVSPNLRIFGVACRVEAAISGFTLLSLYNLGFRVQG